MPTRLSVFGIRIPEKAIQGRYVLPVAILLTAALTVVEGYFRFDFSLGVLYTIPVLIVSGRSSTAPFRRTLIWPSAWRSATAARRALVLATTSIKDG
mgnify:CR=1 FL=1